MAETMLHVYSRVLDWLQWSDDLDETKAQETLSVIGYLKHENQKHMKALTKAREALESYQSYSKMNMYPDHEVRHTLCCEIPQISMDALREIDAILGNSSNG